MAKLQLSYPIKPFVISQNFGENLASVYKDVWHLLGHPGIDMVGSTGQVIRAATEGTVTYTGTDSNEGEGIVIITDNQYDYGTDPPRNFKHIYWHLLDGSTKVKVGDKINRGDVLAQCDSTGVLLGVKFGPSKLSHLHFGIKPVAQGEYEWAWDNVLQTNGYNGCIDPAQFWDGTYSEDPIIPSVTISISPDPIVANISNQLTLYEKVVQLFIKLLKLIQK